MVLLEATRADEIFGGVSLDRGEENQTSEPWDIKRLRTRGGASSEENQKYPPESVLGLEVVRAAQTLPLSQARKGPEDATGFSAEGIKVACICLASFSEGGETRDGEYRQVFPVVLQG